MIKFTLPPATKSIVNEKIDRTCPFCSSKNSHIHARNKRKIKDPKIEEIEQIRLKCTSCNRTWYVYPEGVKRNSSRSKHTVVVSVLLYCFGLSHGIVPLVLKMITLRNLTSKSSSWRDFQKSGNLIKMKKLFACNRSPSIIGGDGTFIRIKGEKACMEVFNDADDGYTIKIALANERKEEELIDLFTQLSDELDLTNFSCFVCDDNPTHSSTLESLNQLRGFSKHWIRQSICLAHSKKTVRSKLKKYQQNKKDPPQHILDEIEYLLDNDFPEHKTEDIRNLSLKAEVTKDKQLHKIVQTLYLKYDKYSYHNKIRGIPKTNNLSEHKFIRPKVRYKSTRGLKSKNGALNFFRNLIMIDQIDIVKDVLIHI